MTRPVIALPRLLSGIEQAILRYMPVVLIVIGSAGLAGYFYQKHQAAIVAMPIAAANGLPSESPLPKPSDYRVPPDQPKIITVSGKANIYGLIQKVGLLKNGQMAAPGNVHMAGWFSGSARPGETGLAIIDGHVDGRFSDAVFKNLGKAQPNDTVEVEFGNGRKVKFKVVSTKQVGVDEASTALFQTPDGAELRLITCAGKWQKDSKTYSQRLIVYAKLVGRANR